MSSDPNTAITYSKKAKTIEDSIWANLNHKVAAEQLAKALKAIVEKPYVIEGQAARIEAGKNALAQWEAGNESEEKEELDGPACSYARALREQSK